MKSNDQLLLRCQRVWSWRMLVPTLAVFIGVSWGCAGAAPAPTTPEGAADDARSNAAATLDDAPATAPGKMPACQGEGFEVDLLDALAALPDDTLEAQREQVRDWIWNVTLARVAQNSTVDDAFSGVADEPLFRDDAMGHVLTFPTGTAR